MSDDKISLSAIAIKELIDCYEIGIGNMVKRYGVIPNIETRMRFTQASGNPDVTADHVLLHTRVWDVIFTMPIWVGVYDQIQQLHDWQNDPPGGKVFGAPLRATIHKQLEQLRLLWEDASTRVTRYGEQLSEKQINTQYKLFQLENLFFNYL